jgi:hypothetical protein
MVAKLGLAQGSKLKTSGSESSSSKNTGRRNRVWAAVKTQVRAERENGRELLTRERPSRAKTMSARCKQKPADQIEDHRQRIMNQGRSSRTKNWQPKLWHRKIVTKSCTNKRKTNSPHKLQILIFSEI